MTRRQAGLLILILAILQGCVEAPFERVNANDSSVIYTMSLVASRDTATTDNSIVYLQVITNPVQTGYTPLWSSTHPSIAVHLGGGVFRFVPGTPTVVTVTASFRERSATYNITRVP